MSISNSEKMKVLSDIIHVIHGDALTYSTFTEILEQINRVVRFDAGMAAYFDTKLSRFETIFVHGIELTGNKVYEEHYGAVDPVPPKARAQGRRIFRYSDIVTRSEFENSEFYTDFVVPYGYPKQVLLASVGAGEGWKAEFALGREDYTFPYADDEVAFLQLIEPHFTNVFQQARIAEKTRRYVGLQQSDLIQSQSALLVLDGNGRLVYMSELARDLHFISDRSPGSLLSVATSEARAVLSESRSIDPVKESLPVRHGAVVVSGRNYHLSIYVSGAGDDCYCLVWIAGSPDHMRSILGFYVDAGRLSEREAEVCAMLVKGLRNRAIAEKLCISEFTVKDHVKSVLAKLGVSNRYEIAGKLLGLSSTNG